MDCISENYIFLFPIQSKIIEKIRVPPFTDVVAMQREYYIGNLHVYALQRRYNVLLKESEAL